MDIVTLIVAILGLVASAIAAVAAVLGLRKPKLTVENMYVPNSQWMAPYGETFGPSKNAIEGRSRTTSCA